MTKDGVKYGISILPDDCIAYADGYRYGAYKRDLQTEETHVTEFFKNVKEIEDFVKDHEEYGRGRA